MHSVPVVFSKYLVVFSLERFCYINELWLDLIFELARRVKLPNVTSYAAMCQFKIFRLCSVWCFCCTVHLLPCLWRLKRGKVRRSDTGPCMLRWSRIASRQMVCRLITRSTHPIAGDETVLTVSNALPRGPYHRPLLACLLPLFLFSWCYLSGDLCRNVQLVDLPGLPASLLQGRRPVISWAMQRYQSSGCWPHVWRRLSCLCTSNRHDACKGRQQSRSCECCSLYFMKWKRAYACIRFHSVVFCYSMF